jgi:predicted dehydrogenase
VTATYAATADELLALARDARTRWTPAQQTEFDAEVAALRQAVDAAAEGRPRQRAWRAMIRYVQGAVVRDPIVLASSGATP